mmetsp:Transcript_14940/g.24889  ORF Transcript_14940/g.24889 Transcript_14940/m.24889 type:complete len:112 (+) Transcript_14940:2468-2803(+)
MSNKRNYNSIAKGDRGANNSKKHVNEKKSKEDLARLAVDGLNRFCHVYSQSSGTCNCFLGMSESDDFGARLNYAINVLEECHDVEESLGKILFTPPGLMPEFYPSAVNHVN